MKGFIIKYKTRLDGNDVTTYHSGISLARPESLVMNVYSEHITTKKEEAMVFHTKEEAQKICALFVGTFHIGKIIQK
jgi:hypothetical protein